MAIFKNISGQKLAVFAWDTVNAEPKTGDAANITAQISLDGAATAATNDTNPTELDATDAPGVYIFDLTQAETNADLIVLSADSSSTAIELDPVIAHTEVQQTGDSYARIGANGAGLTALAALIEAALVDDGDATAFLQAVADKIAGDLTTGDVTTQAIASATRDAILDRVLNGNHDTAGTTGLLLQYLDAAVSSRNATTPPTAAAVADAVWDEATSGHASAGTFGKALSDILGKFTGMTSLPGWLRWIARKDAGLATDDATSGSEINADGGSGAGAYDNTDDAQEALRDNQGGGTADWTDDEKEQIRYRLQLDGDQTAPDDTDLPEVNVKQVNGTAVSAGALSVSVTSPVATSGTITLYAGADYSSNTAQLGITLSNYTGPDPTGATFVFRASPIAAFNAGDSTNVLGSIATTAALSGSDLPLLFDLDATASALLTDENPPKKPWNYRYVVLWTKDGEEYPIAEGSLTAKQLIGAGS